MSIFDDLWAIYPKKVGKGTARKALAKALTKAPIDQIQHSLSLFVRSWGQQDKKFMPHLATWLNGERWDDEIQQPSSAGHDLRPADAGNPRLTGNRQKDDPMNYEQRTKRSAHGCKRNCSRMTYRQTTRPKEQQPK